MSDHVNNRANCKQKTTDMNHRDEHKFQSIDNLQGAYYMKHFLDEELTQLLFDKCKKYMHEPQNLSCTYRILGYPYRGPVALTITDNVPLFIKEGIVDKLKCSEALESCDNKNLVECLQREIFQMTMNYYDQSTTSLSPHKDSKGRQVFIISLGAKDMTNREGWVMDFWKLNKGGSYSILFGSEQDPYSVDSSHSTEEDLISEIYGPPSVTVNLDPGSCLLMSGDSFVDYLHGIQCRSSRTERVSILCWS